MEPEQCFGDLGSRIIKEMEKKNTVVLREEKENKEKRRGALSWLPAV